MLTKFFKSELFSCLPKVDYAINKCKRLIPAQTGSPALARLSSLEMGGGGGYTTNF